ncbi:MAG TPA: RsfS/YbeB/iojap family protein, partial [Solirubrobacteraceae bacterium]
MNAETQTTLAPEQMAAAIAELATDRKAIDVVQLDLRGMIGYADYFMICSGRTDRQT